MIHKQTHGVKFLLDWVMAIIQGEQQLAFLPQKEFTLLEEEAQTRFLTLKQARGATAHRYRLPGHF